MIPTIETIVEDLLSGAITKQQAVGWLHIHADDAGRDLRDEFAAAALTGLCARTPDVPRMYAADAYIIADAMLAARSQP